MNEERERVTMLMSQVLGEGSNGLGSMLSLNTAASATAVSPNSAGAQQTP